MADLTDEDYRAIARAAHSFTANLNLNVVDSKGVVVMQAWSITQASEEAERLNGRAAVAEYERRKR